MQHKSGPDSSVADAVDRGWVDTLAPAWARPYLRLMRADRPIGTWLLLWPCWWSLGLAAIASGAPFPDPWLIFLFAAGATVMRGAGCIFNDIVDRDFDAKVARTRSRPIPSGQVSVPQALAFLVALVLTGFVILIQFNLFAILLGIASLTTVAVYPFMKRITYWPQIFLGLAFNWGAMLGWAAVFGSLSAAPLILYGAGIAWTLGYDTIYAHQDKEDDVLIGVKSTALKFGARTHTWMIGFYAAAFILLGLAGLGAGAGPAFFTGLAVGGAHLAWQIKMLVTDDADRLLMLFRSNRDFGWIIFFGMLADAALNTV